LTVYHGLSSITYCNEDLGNGQEGGLVRLQAQISAYWNNTWEDTFDLRVFGDTNSSKCFKWSLDPGDYVKEMVVWYNISTQIPIKKLSLITESGYMLVTSTADGTEMGKW
jgi:hypothetical protein